MSRPAAINLHFAIACMTLWGGIFGPFERFADASGNTTRREESQAVCETCMLSWQTDPCCPLDTASSNEASFYEEDNEDDPNDQERVARSSPLGTRRVLLGDDDSRHWTADAGDVSLLGPPQDRCIGFSRLVI